MRCIIFIKRASVEIICFLYIVLFVYAAVSKLLDFENFQVQLGQSPLISSFAGFLSYFVPLLELVLALSLVFLRSRLIGLYFSFFLMGLFSAYIFIMVTFSPFVPCSCGGVLENLTWRQHLYFNLLFVVFGGIGLYLLRQKTNLRFFMGLICLLLFSFVLLYVLFQTSEKMHHQRNNFTRNFPHHPIELLQEMDLGVSVYYVAGVSQSSIYLGNHGTPLLVTEIDSSLQLKTEHVITLPKISRSFKSLTLTVNVPYFYIWDGAEAFVYWGKIGDWKATLLFDGDAYFTSFVPVSPQTASIRAISSANDESVLGTISIQNGVDVRLYPEVLKKQVDGLFDTDGMHLYNQQRHQLLYTYYYRNQYIVADTLMHRVFYGKTIDTTTKADLKVKYIRSLKGSKMSVPVVTVNKRTATFGSQLYIYAGLLGRYEPRDNWDHNSVIDVYDFTANLYDFSFYLPDKFQHKVRDFCVYEDLIYTLNGPFIRTHRLKKGYY